MENQENGNQIVYVLTNPAMPGLVKIGLTTRENPQLRMDELYSTGVPFPFECVIAKQIEEARAGQLEQALHTAFKPYRVNPSREFFAIEIYQVKALLCAWPGTDVTPQVNKETEALPDVEREAGKRFESRKPKRPNLNFDEMGIPTGSLLVSSDTGEEATVIEPKKVRFRGEEMALHRATQLALNVEYKIKPLHYWTFNGRSLQEIYDKRYPLE